MKLEALREKLRSEHVPDREPIEAVAVRSLQANPCEGCGGPRRIRKREGALVEADCVACRRLWRGSVHRCPTRNTKGKLCNAPVSKAGAYCYECDEQGGESWTGQPICDEDEFEFCEYLDGADPKYVFRCLRCHHAFTALQTDGGARCPSCGNGPLRP